MTGPVILEQIESKELFTQTNLELPYLSERFSCHRFCIVGEIGLTKTSSPQ